MAKQKNTNAAPRPKTAVQPTTEATSSPDRQAIVRDALLQISSMNFDDAPAFLEPWEGKDNGDSWGSRFLWNSSQINLDLSTAAQMEAEGDIWPDSDGNGMYDFFYSPAFWQLRETFVADALKGDEGAFLMAIWRAYSAGRVCPNRLSPRTQLERTAERLIHHDQIEAAKQEGFRRTEEALNRAKEILSK